MLIMEKHTDLEYWNNAAEGWDELSAGLLEAGNVPEGFFYHDLALTARWMISQLLFHEECH